MQHSWNGAIDLTKEREVSPSDGDEEAVAPRVAPVPSKPTQAEQDEHHATGHATCRSWCEHCVRGRGRVSSHVSVLEGELPEVGVDAAYMGLEGSQVTILVCKCKRTGCLAATGAREGHGPGVLCWMAARLGWKRLLRSGKRMGIAGVSPCCSREFGRCRSDRASEP